MPCTPCWARRPHRTGGWWGLLLLVMGMTFAGSFGVPRRHWDISFSNAPYGVEFTPAVDLIQMAGKYIFGGTGTAPASGDGLGVLFVELDLLEQAQALEFVQPAPYGDGLGREPAVREAGDEDAARLQQATDLPQHLLRPHQVLDGRGADHGVEARIGKGDRLVRQILEQRALAGEGQRGLAAALDAEADQRQGGE